MNCTKTCPKGVKGSGKAVAELKLEIAKEF